jgi:hypothetical protein
MVSDHRFFCSLETISYKRPAAELYMGGKWDVIVKWGLNAIYLLRCIK